MWTVENIIEDYLEDLNLPIMEENEDRMSGMILDELTGDFKELEENIEEIDEGNQNNNIQLSPKGRQIDSEDKL